MVLTLGTSASVFFMVTIDEPKLSAEALTFERAYKVQTLGEHAVNVEEEAANKRGTGGRDWKAWLNEGTFYVHGMVYMLVRVAVNVTMTVQPFYLEQALKFKGDATQPTPTALAAVPLGSYITSLIFSIWF